MQIVILAGGSGSVALQSGLYHMLEKRMDSTQVKIIVNAYDNGRSTGTVRQVMDGRILGPSDVRKNQAVRCRLNSPNSPWLKYLDYRFTTRPSQARELCLETTVRLVRELDAREQPAPLDLLCNAIDGYFSSTAAATVEYDDFSLANIIYAGLAKANGNSLRAAAQIMARAIGIPDVVLLNDDESLFLGAITQSGHVIHDEGEIVCWGNELDPIFDVFFTDAAGNAAEPQLCFEAWQTLVEADLIVLSSGTQWSSLIPTYASAGFKTAINESNAKVIMVMNRVPDMDSPGQSSSDIINALVPRYYDTGKLHVLADKNGHPALGTLDQSALAKVASFARADLSGPGDPANQHNPAKLAANIGYVYFQEYLQSDFYLFDYDDTLCGRGNVHPRSSQFNIEALGDLNLRTNVSICTGNSIEALNLHGMRARSDSNSTNKPIFVFADGGINKYSLDREPALSHANGDIQAVECVAPSVLLPDSGPHSAANIVAALTRAGIPASKIHNRGNALISIRPIDHDHRPALVNQIAHILRETDLQVRLCGRSTVEICRTGLSKGLALNHLLNGFGTSQRITFIGDECETGNDRDIAILAEKDSRIRCLHVRDPAETAFFIATLSTQLSNNASR